MVLVSVKTLAQLPSYDLVYEPSKPLDQRGHTYSITLVLQLNEKVDLYQFMPADCNEGWAEANPPAYLNGVKASFIAWNRPAKVIAETSEISTVTIWCK